MGRALFEPLLQNLGHRPANGLLLLAAAIPDCLNQRFGKLTVNTALGSGTARSSKWLWACKR